ncbi:glycopeptide antibiotics resistance protein [Paenibacillus sp. BK033]|uniref:VanZ family protein n=1 Tax=Paenibacillus sp. BK033 TaxID=2512133 RepID=UPI00105373B2|nr:VanZ family protein [Paenibacillus sp. BK033]TCM96538.1 glycopeptide antibiotics resistance protein [Paenibacillus sp. BK033]
MRTRERIESVFLYGVFICYSLLLLKIFFLSRVSIPEIFDSHRTIVRSINFIPFYSISEFLAGHSANARTFAFGNVAGNIFLFIPLGVYISLFKNDKRVTSLLLFLFIASLMVEIIQGALGIGIADIDDVILNSLGGWIGIIAYKAMLFIVRNEKRARSAITVLSVVIGLPVIYYFLFMIRMKL